MKIILSPLVPSGKPGHEANPHSYVQHTLLFFWVEKHCYHPKPWHLGQVLQDVDT